MVVEVLPDVSGIDRTFVYDVPAELAGRVEVGSIVRVLLHGRRVRGWVVAETTVPPLAVDLRPLGELVSLGPPSAVVDLCRWAAWRYAGRLRPLLVAASPPRLVRALPAAPAVREQAARQAPGGDATARGTLEAELAAATVQALSSSPAVLRLPPAAPRLAVVEAVVAETAGRAGDVLVLAASRADAVTLASRLERAGHAVALQPEAWSQAASGGRIVVGARSAVLSPVARLRAVVVLDAHADSYQEERVPTWEATVLASERARRSGVPCLLVSPCPTLELLAGRRLVTLSREGEAFRVGARRGDRRSRRRPSCGRLSLPTGNLDPLRGRRRPGPAGPGGPEPERPCPPAGLRALQELAPLCQLRGGSRPARTPGAGRADSPALPPLSRSGPAVCASCGPTRPRIVRAGVARVRDDLAALTGLDVAEIGRPGAGPGELGDAPVLIGTEGVLHRAGSACLVVFLDFDHELLAPRYRAGEQALALLALASRVVGGRRREGRVVVRTRLPDHEVLAAAVHADPGRLATAEEPRRALLRLPPATALALVSGDGAEQVAAWLKGDPAVEVGGLAAGRFLIRAPGPDALADALASAGRPTQGARIEVGPRQV